MAKQLVEAQIISQAALGAQIYRLQVCAPLIAASAKPGQFVQLMIPDAAHILRRPLSIAMVEGDIVTFIYKVVGSGTKKLAKLQAGQLNLLGPLGNGFLCSSRSSLLVGGGLGIAPLYFLARSLPGRKSIVLGARNAAELAWAKILFAAVTDAKLHFTTDDGSLGYKGLTVDLLPQMFSKEKYEAIYTCGPEMMMRSVAVAAASQALPCWVSLEKRMGCGLGACLSCTIETLHGRKKVCKDGPVFAATEVFL